MEKMTLEEYLSLHGYSSPVDFYMIDKIKLPHGETQRQKEKREKEIHTRSAAYHAERNRLIDEFNQKVENGEIIIPSRIEQTIATAKYGHPDNSSTQAAIRMLHKRGYTLTNQGEWVKKNLKIEKEELDKIIQKIKQRVHIEEIAPRYGLTLVKIGNYLTSKEHDSLRIDVAKQKFWHNSQLIGGDVIDFVRYFGNVDFGGAVEQLKSIANISTDIQSHTQSSLGRFVPAKLNAREFILPEKDNNNKNVFAYLTQTRKINADIVNDLINSNHLFQDVHKNCVFVGYDENQKPIFANQRGTNTEKKFVADVVNSNYNECFYLNNNSNKLIIAESVIDVLSIATIIAATQGEYQNYNYLALSGTTKRQSIFHHLEQQPEIDTLILSLDNDKAGELASQKVKEQLQEMEWTGSIIDYTSALKDWNEDLQQGIYARIPHCLSQEEVQKEMEYICNNMDDFDV